MSFSGSKIEYRLLQDYGRGRDVTAGWLAKALLRHAANLNQRDHRATLSSRLETCSSSCQIKGDIFGQATIYAQQFAIFGKHIAG
jgi:hypothetical protein